MLQAKLEPEGVLKQTIRPLVHIPHKSIALDLVSSSTTYFSDVLLPIHINESHQVAKLAL